VCPECGRPVRESLTRRRRGSPWQRAPGVGSWVMTTAGLLVSPRSFWDDVRVEEWKSWNLMNVNLMVTSSVPFLLAAFFGAFGMGALMWLVMFVTLFILNMMVT